MEPIKPEDTHMLEMLLPFIIGAVVIGGFVALGPFYLVREQSVAPSWTASQSPSRS